MTKYTLAISWMNSVETVTLDLDDLPQPGTAIATTETWEGQEHPADYHVDVVEVRQDGLRYALILRYDELRNTGLAGVNTAWGTSSISLDLRGTNPKASAVWKNDPPDPAFDGRARVKVMRVPPDSLLGDLLAIGAANGPTERETLVAARIGQGRFRSDVIRAWQRGETCALTGIAIPEMLVASHIKPWADCEDGDRLHPANGLLLATHVDKLFDAFLLSFKHQGEGIYQVQMHPRVRKVAGGLGLDECATLDACRLGAYEPMFREFMGGHYERFLKKCDAEALPDPAPLE